MSYQAIYWSALVPTGKARFGMENSGRYCHEEFTSCILFQETLVNFLQHSNIYPVGGGLSVTPEILKPGPAAPKHLPPDQH